MHCPYCHGFEFGGGQLGVLSVSSMFAHQALLISDWGPTTFFLNGNSDLDDATRRKLAHRRIAIEGDPGAPLRVLLSGGRSSQVDALYVGAQIRMNSPIAKQLGCALDDSLFGPLIRTDAAKLTTVAGVYAAGDITRGRQRDPRIGGWRDGGSLAAPGAAVWLASGQLRPSLCPTCEIATT